MYFYFYLGCYCETISICDYTHTHTRAHTVYAGGASLMKSGIIPLGTIPSAFSDSHVNLHLLPTNENLSENGGPLSSRPGKLGKAQNVCDLQLVVMVTIVSLVEYGLNLILSLLPNYSGHPSYQLLVETLRNQVQLSVCACCKDCCCLSLTCFPDPDPKDILHASIYTLS